MTTTQINITDEATFAEDVADTWLMEAMANRRQDIMLFIDEAKDDPMGVFYEFLTVARELGASDHQLQDGLGVYEALLATANATVRDLERHVIDALLDEREQ